MAQRSFKRFTITWLAAVVGVAAGGLALNIRHDPSGVLAALSLKPLKANASDLWSAGMGLYPMRAGNREGSQRDLV